MFMLSTFFNKLSFFVELQSNSVLWIDGVGMSVIMFSTSG